MRILHLGNIPIPLDIPGCDRARATQHPGRWVLNHALAQKAAGMDIEVISQAHKAPRDFDCDIEGVRIHFLRTYHPYRHFTFYALDAWRMARLVRKLAPDIVHAHGTEAAYGHAALQSGLPFCITAQGLFFQIIPTLGRPPTWNERFLRWGEDAVLRRTHFVIAKSDYVKEALAQQYPHLDITQIPNTYEPGLDAPLVEKIPHSLVFVGSMDLRKGVHLLTAALADVVKSIPDVTLHIIGNPPEQTATGYTGEQIHALRSLLGDRLVLHGRLASSELFALLGTCTALVAPSLEEMFGNQLIEGLMRGCYGIVADHTALAENVRRFGNGTIVPQRDVPALTLAIQQTLLHPPSSTDIETARQKVRNYMSPPAVAHAHALLYRRILG